MDVCLCRSFHWKTYYSKVLLISQSILVCGSYVTYVFSTKKTPNTICEKSILFCAVLCEEFLHLSSFSQFVNMSKKHRNYCFMEKQRRLLTFAKLMQCKRHLYTVFAPQIICSSFIFRILIYILLIVHTFHVSY